MERPWCRFRREARARERRRLPKVVDSLKVLDPNRPIREADILSSYLHVHFVPEATSPSSTKQPALIFINELTANRGY